MFGSLMMLASGLVASAPSSASSSLCRCAGVSFSGKLARMRPASEISFSLTDHAGRADEGLDDRQQRIGRKRRGFVDLRPYDFQI